LVVLVEQGQLIQLQVHQLPMQVAEAVVDIIKQQVELVVQAVVELVLED
tara:strand:- start:156 stop:302 length:147 start_codon:yes stop_codon:yes gene_type:complete